MITVSDLCDTCDALLTEDEANAVRPSGRCLCDACNAEEVAANPNNAA